MPENAIFINLPHIPLNNKCCVNVLFWDKNDNKDERVFFSAGTDLTKLFSLLLLLRTGRREIKCAGTPVLVYSQG